jgi:hypothetical protein
MRAALSSALRTIWGQNDVRQSTLVADDLVECTVCDHPFGHMAHVCLSSDVFIGIAS